MYIFISHSSTDAAIAEDVCSILEATGVQCFLAPRDIRSGYEYAAEIVNGLDRSDILLFLLSNKANESPHVLREIERAVSNSTPIIVYKLEEVTLTKSMEYFLMTHQWLNAEKGDYSNLLRSVQSFKETGDEDATSAPVETAATTASPLPIQKKSRTSFIPWIAIGGVIIALVAIICLLLFSGDKEDETPTSKEPNIVESSSTTTTSSTENFGTTTENTTDDSTENSSTSVSNTAVQLGDTIVLGKYNDVDISWSVIKISEDNTEAVLISKNILTFKAFNGAENGDFGYDENGAFVGLDPAMNTDMEFQANVRGNNSWETSDIRTWLNSEDEYVTYEGYGPIADAMADHKNAYNLEAGFLCNFSLEELSAIKETTIETKGNALSDSPTVTTTDRVFLLSMDEVQWIKDAKVSLYTAPTDEAIEKNESFYYRDYCLDTFKTTSCLWWLREPLEDSVSECYLVSHGAKPDLEYENAIVAVEEFGIRPAITVDLTSEYITIE